MKVVDVPPLPNSEPIPMTPEPAVIVHADPADAYGYAKWDRVSKRLVEVNSAFLRLIEISSSDLLGSNFTWEQLGLTSRLTNRAENDNPGHDAKYEVAISFFKLKKAHEKLRLGLGTTFRFKICFVPFSGKAQYVRMTIMGTETKDIWVAEEVCCVVCLFFFAC